MHKQLAGIVILSGLVLSGCTGDDAKWQKSVISVRPAETKDEKQSPVSSSGDVKEAERIETEERFSQVGQWKSYESQSGIQTMRLLRQANLNETFAFGDIEVQLESVDLIEFVDPLFSLDEFTDVKVGEAGSAYGIQVAYQVRKVRDGKREDQYYLGPSRIVTSEGQTMVQYETGVKEWKEGDRFRTGLEGIWRYTTDNWMSCELISLLQPGTVEDISWVEIHLGATGEEPGFLDEDWEEYAKEFGPIVRISLGD